MTMNRAYEVNTSCGACAPSVRAVSCCARTASVQPSSSSIILILDAIIMASIIIFTLLGELCLVAVLPALVISLRFIRKNVNVPGKRMFA